MTSADRITWPGRRSGAKPPATPKLTRHFASRAAFSRRTIVRPWSPAPTMTGNPAARATLASAASPEVHSTDVNVRMQPPPLRQSGLVVGLTHDPRYAPTPPNQGTAA